VAELTEVDQPPVDPLPDEEASEPEPRRHPSTIGGLFYLVVLGITAVGIGISWTGDWRLGVKWVGAALILGAVVRLVLPRRDAGMLAVRNRAVDAVMLSSVGAILIFLTESIPNQPL
jgi:Protein of unknown function (DUF3017)